MWKVHKLIIFFFLFFIGTGYSKVSYPVDINDYEKICSLLVCDAYRDSSDDFEYYLKEFLKRGSGYTWPYLAVTKGDIGTSGGVAWQMSDSRYQALNGCKDYDDDCIVIIENGSITNEYFLKKFLEAKSVNYSNSISDEAVCRLAMLNDGSGWENYNEHVEEAMNRSLTIYDCRVLLDIKPKPRNSRGGR